MATAITAQDTTQDLAIAGEDPRTDDVAAWLKQVFVAARTPVPCRLPAPRITERVDPPARCHTARPAVRTSFVAMLALSLSALALSQ